MPSQFKCSAIVLFLLVSPSIQASATAPREGSVEHRHPVEPLSVKWFHSRVDGKGLWVTGFVRKEIFRAGPVPGFIRLAVPRDDGTGESIVCLASRDLRPAGARGGTFHVRLPGASHAELVDVRYVRTCG